MHALRRAAGVLPPKRARPQAQGKDVFEAFYKKDLAKRLLLGRRRAPCLPPGVAGGWACAP